MNHNPSKFLSLIYVWTLLFAQTITLFGFEKDQGFEKLGNYIKNRMESTRTPSISIGVSHQGSIVWEESFGWADREEQIKATPNTVYSIASVSKPMTATAMMILKERGLLDLKNPVDSYLGKTKLTVYKGQTEDVTVNRLLHHTAGLPTIWNFCFADGQLTRPQIAESISKFGIITKSPGTDYEYSNLGYGIAEHIIEQVSENSFDQFMKSEVFDPLGMNNTFIITNSTQYESIAPRYLENKNKSPFYDVMSHGGGGICSSINDLIRFGRFHINTPLEDQIQILSEQSVNIMQTAVDPTQPDSPYKIGWNVKNFKGHSVASHGGGMPGVSSALLLVPEQELIVAILSNGTYIDLMEIGYYIISLLVSEKGQSEEQNMKKENSEKKNITFPSDVFTGRWNGNIYTDKRQMPVILIIDESGKVNLELKDKKELINPFNKFAFRYETLSGSFDFNIGTEETSFCRTKVHFKLRLNENELYGYVAAESHRVEVFYLPYFISLTKQ